MKRKVPIDVIGQMLNAYSSSDDMFQKSLAMLWPHRSEKVRYMIITAMSLGFAVRMACAYDTVFYARKMLDLVQAVMLALFGALFTGYALFQALLGNQVVAWLASDLAGKPQDRRSRLQETNAEFANIMMLCIASIFLNVTVSMFLAMIPDDWCLFSSAVWNEVLSGAGIFAVFYMELQVIAEVKCLIYNFVQLIFFYMAAKIKEMAENDEIEIIQDAGCGKEQDMD